MLLEPLGALNEQSNIDKCSSFKYGAPSIVSLSSMYSDIASTSSLRYPSRLNAIGTWLLTSLSVPPPTSFLYLTSASSGSIPVVSQSIKKLIVPVGAKTVTCEFLTPYSSANSFASCQTKRADVSRYLSSALRPCDSSNNLSPAPRCLDR